MSEDRSSSGSPGPKSWLERISQTLSGEPKNRKDLVELLREAEQNQIIDNDALGMIEGALQVSEMQVRDIMVPRSQMVVVEQNMRAEAYLPIIIESAHSRFPVIGEDRDDIIGLLLAKDLLSAQLNQNESLDINDLLREALFVPESKRLDAMLKEFRLNHNHMAIVIDEYGCVAGLVTIEDVLEQIVGEIEDEHDIYPQETNIQPKGESQFTIKALTSIDEFNEYFDSAFKHDEYDTVGGLVMQALGHLPHQGESVNIGNYHFEILHADNRRITLLEATILKEETSHIA